LRLRLVEQLILSYEMVIRNNARRQVSRVTDILEPEHRIPPLDALIIPKAIPECKTIHSLISRLLRRSLICHIVSQVSKRYQGGFMLKYRHGFKQKYRGHSVPT